MRSMASNLSYQPYITADDGNVHDGFNEYGTVGQATRGDRSMKLALLSAKALQEPDMLFPFLYASSSPSWGIDTQSSSRGVQSTEDRIQDL